MICRQCKADKSPHLFQPNQAAQIRAGKNGRCRNCANSRRPVPAGRPGWRDPKHRERFASGNCWTPVRP
jgi:hypothetical protein